jgi:PadR family transcriptional regulator PadR
LTKKFLSRPEEIVLMAVWKLQGNAYGVSIRNLVQKMTAKYWSIGAVYVPLERLEKKGYLISEESEPLKERGGRRKRLFRISREGKIALDEMHSLNTAVWRGYKGFNPGDNQ